MGRIIRGYWTCPYCETTDIDGLVDYCPNCARHKPEHTKYYMANGVVAGKTYHADVIQSNEVVSDEELQHAGIQKEECDGNHPEWKCPYCNSLNNWSDDTCSSCGAPRGRNSEDYFDTGSVGNEMGSHAENKNHTTQYTHYNEEARHKTSQKRTFKDWISRNISQIGIGAGIIALVAAIGFLIFPYKEVATVDGFSWERSINIEQERTVKESDWSVPVGGRCYDTELEIQSYIDVLDHYETVIETKTKQVLDHYETTYSYVDNGNGTFTEYVYQTPVYRTEVYTEPKQEPVYRKEPVYETKYYYEIERWFFEYASESSGIDKEPYWNENYTLKNQERDTDRSEKYTIYFDNGDAEDCSYEKWQNADVGDEVIITRCRLWIYKIDSQLEDTYE